MKLLNHELQVCSHAWYYDLMAFVALTVSEFTCICKAHLLEQGRFARNWWRFSKTETLSQKDENMDNKCLTKQ